MEVEHEFISDIVYPEIYSTQRLSSCGNNFLIWKLKLDFILSNRKLYHLLNPPSPPPIPPRAYPINMDSSVGLILQTLDDGLQTEFFNYPNAECILGTIFTRFTSLLKRCKIHKIKDYLDLRMVDGTPINQHIFRMRAMAKELEYIGVIIPDDIHALILLNSLPEEWAEDVECLLREMGVHKKEISLDYVSHWLMNLMDVIKWRHFSNWKSNLKGNCYVCGKLGHYQSDCPDQASSNILSSPVCPFPLGQASLLRILYRDFNSFLKMKCDCSNYSLWKAKLFQVLRQGGVDYIVDDSIPIEQTKFACEAELQQSKWQDDFLCRHLILGTMDDDIFLSFHDYPTSNALLEAVEACFGYASPARKLHLLQEYMCCRMREGSQISGHTTKMEKMVQKLTSCYDLQVPDEMQSVILLDSLPSTWENSLQTLYLYISKKDDLRFKTVKKGVLKIGRPIRVLYPGQDAVSDSHDCRCINNRNNAFRRNRCYCRRPGHQQANCPEF